MNYPKNFSVLAQELGLNFNEDSIESILLLLENGVSPENIVLMLEDIKKEISRVRK